MTATGRVLVVADQGDSDPGHVGERLVMHGYQLVPALRGTASGVAGGGVAPSDLEGVDILLLLGSDHSVADPSRQAEVRSEQVLVLQAAAEGRSVLGICYGAQLVASALGAEVRRADRPELGWHRLETTDERLAPAGPWFQAHRDRWIAGPGLPALARTAIAPQALRHGRILGWQFHPEVTPDIVRRWLGDLDDIATGSGADLEAVLAETDARSDEARTHCHRLVDAYLEEVVGAPAVPV